MRARTIAAAFLVIAGSAHAAGRDAGRPNDPFEPVNRAGFAVQMTLDRYFIGPLAAIYHAVTPGPIGKAVHHFLVNLSEPIVAINDMLQLRPARATKAATRFVLNSTLRRRRRAGCGGDGGDSPPSQLVRRHLGPLWREAGALSVHSSDRPIDGEGSVW